MFNDIVNDFDLQMIRNRVIKNFENSSSSSSSSSIRSNDEHNDYPFYALDGMKTRIVWITNYINNEDFPIHVSVNDPLLHIVNTSSSTIEQKSLFSNENNTHTLDLSKLNLDDLLLLLYRLQKRTTKNSVTTSNSTISSSSSSSSSPPPGFIAARKSSSQMTTLHSLSPTLSHVIQTSLSMLNDLPSHSINHRQSSFTLSNIADVPKQLMTTLAKPISSLHSQNKKHIHSPNDVVDKLLQSFHLRNTQKLIESTKSS